MHQRIQQLDRRTVLRSAAGLFVAGSGLAVYSQRATAQVTMGSLSIPDGEFKDQDGEIYAPYLRVDGEWSYDIGDLPDTWEVRLALVADDGSRAELDMDSGDLNSQADSGTYSVVGKVTDADFYSASDFSVATEGETKTVTLDVLILFFVRNGPTILAKDKITDDPAIKVTHAEEAALVGGEGELGAQHDETGTPPF